MKDQLHFIPSAKNDLKKIERTLGESNYIKFFYDKLAQNLCTLLREVELDINKLHTISFEEKSIPKLSNIKVKFSIRHEAIQKIVNIKSISIS